MGKGDGRRQDERRQNGRRPSPARGKLAVTTAEEVERDVAGRPHYEFQPGPLLAWGNIFYRGNLDTFARDVTAHDKTLEQWFATSLPFEAAAAVSHTVMGIAPAGR